MERFSFLISDDNKRRIEILQAFSVLGDGRKPTLQDLVNQSIELFYVIAYENYASNPQSDLLTETMKSVLPQKEITEQDRE